MQENIAETLTFYRLPRGHHKHLKSSNMRERLNEEIKRRTRVVRIFPNVASCLRLMRALAVETHEDWLEEHRYLNMDLLVGHSAFAQLDRRNRKWLHPSLGCRPPVERGAEWSATGVDSKFSYPLGHVAYYDYLSAFGNWGGTL